MKIHGNIGHSGKIEHIEHVGHIRNIDLYQMPGALCRC